MEKEEHIQLLSIPGKPSVQEVVERIHRNKAKLNDDDDDDDYNDDDNEKEGGDEEEEEEDGDYVVVRKKIMTMILMSQKPVRKLQ